MRSKLIKDSLKLTIQTKRKNSGKEELDVKSELVTKRHKREEVELTYDFSNDSFAESLPPTKVPHLLYFLCLIDCWRGVWLLYPLKLQQNNQSQLKKPN